MNPRLLRACDAHWREFMGGVPPGVAIDCGSLLGSPRSGTGVVVRISRLGGIHAGEWS